MQKKITIIGLGQVGASIGLALAPYKGSLLRVGHDVNPAREREALRRGALDKIEHNLPAAAQGAQLIVIAVPANQAYETLEFIAQDVEDGALVLDSSPIQTGMAKRARELLPAGRFYAGLRLSLNPELLHEFSFGQDSARADFYHNAVCLVAPAAGVSESAVSLAMDFARLLGAQPLLTDTYEADGLTTCTHLLPQLISAALLNATAAQPGWADSRKIASRAYATLTSGLSYYDDPQSLALAAAENRSAMLGALDRVIDALRVLRGALQSEAGDSSFAALLQSALSARQRWVGERFAADWNLTLKSEAANAPSFFDRLLGTGLFKKPRKRE